MDPKLDRDGQPATPAFNWDRRLDRGMDELVGIARGVLADGALVVEEARFLFEWLRRNEPIRRDFFGKTLYAALSKVLADDDMDADEEDQLVGLLLSFTGGTPADGIECSYSTTLPLDEPPPEIIVTGCSFCFTGKFEFGSRRDCETCVLSAGGMVHKYPTQQTHFLVIGILGSRDWIHSNSGRKIERAIEIRSLGRPIRLVAEAHWSMCVGRLPTDSTQFKAKEN